jgi:hypothetical protein
VFTGATVTVYVSIESPPFEVGAVTLTVAVVVLPLVTAAATGAVGVVGATPSVITAVPDSTLPLGRVVVAVIVNCVDEITDVGVPEMVPVVVFNVKPAGSDP